MFLIRAEGNVYNKVKEPYAVFDKSLGVLHKIGEREEMEKYFELVQDRYRTHGFFNQADDIGLMELPKNQVEIDKVFGITGYIGKLYKLALLK